MDFLYVPDVISYMRGRQYVSPTEFENTYGINGKNEKKKEKLHEPCKICIERQKKGCLSTYIQKLRQSKKMCIEEVEEVENSEAPLSVPVQQSVVQQKT